MSTITKRVTRIGVFALLFLLILWLFSHIATAQGSGKLNTRLNRLESKQEILRIDIRRLRDQLDNRRRLPNRQQLSPSVPAPSSPSTFGPVPSDYSMFDRLATLVIELKERVNELEQRVDELEADVPPQAPPANQPTSNPETAE